MAVCEVGTQNSQSSLCEEIRQLRQRFSDRGFEVREISKEAYTSLDRPVPREIAKFYGLFRTGEEKVLAATSVTHLYETPEKIEYLSHKELETRMLKEFALRKENDRKKMNAAVEHWMKGNDSSGSVSVPAGAQNWITYNGPGGTVSVPPGHAAYDGLVRFFETAREFKDANTTLNEDHTTTFVLNRKSLTLPKDFINMPSEMEKLERFCREELARKNAVKVKVDGII